MRKKNKYSTSIKKTKTSKSQKPKRLKKEALLSALVAAFQSNPKGVYNYKQMSRLIGIENQTQKLQISSLLQDLVLDGFLIEVDLGRYRYNDLGLVEIGTFHRRSNGKNFFVPNEGDVSIFVAERNSMPWMEIK